VFSVKGDFFLNSQESYGISALINDIYILNQHLNLFLFFVEPKKVLRYYILQCLGSYAHILTQGQIIYPILT
jgi:hypothetical protein